MNSKSELKSYVDESAEYSSHLRACYNIELMFVNNLAIEFFLDSVISGIAPL
jgi:hypothetical protein